MVGADDAAETDGSRPTVVYVMGSGHSGSTILGVTLGNCDGWFYSGELQNFLSRSGTAVLGGVERVRFWGVVRDQVPEARELFGYDALRVIERSMSLLRIDRWARRRRLRGRYRRVSERVLQAVARTASAGYVIDSSHFPLRARELQALPGLDLYIVFLVREPQHVVSSINRTINRHDVLARLLSTLRRNMDLWLTHLISLWVFARQPRDRRIFVRYEDFIAAPEAVLSRIVRGAGSAAAVPDLQRLSTGMPIHANRLIRKETVALRIHEPTDDARSRITALMQRPWAPVFARLAPAAGREP